MADFEVRQTWRNHLGNQQIDPLRIYTPGSIDEVSTIIAAAEQGSVTAYPILHDHEIPSTIGAFAMIVKDFKSRQTEDPS